MSIVDKLPSDLARHRILSSAEAAEFWNVSLPHWRRLYRMGKVPKPIRIGDRKLGWQFGGLIDALAERAREAA
jgi:predicted DNA-binding transcriptional regulator AlpA